MNTLIWKMSNFFRILMCKVGGHEDEVPIIETWESKSGGQRSMYLCSRCLIYIGEKPYA